jgi:cell division protein FtsB
MTVNSPTARTPGRFAQVRAIWERLAVGRRKALTAAAAALAVGVGYHVIFGPDGLTVYEQKQQQTQRLNQEMQDLQRENDLLQGHVDRLQSDPNAIEHEAREQLRYTRPGEVIYTLPGK